MHNLISFLGVLTTAVLLVCVGHVAPADVAVISAGLGTLFSSWRNRDQHNDTATMTPRSEKSTDRSR